MCGNVNIKRVVLHMSEFESIVDFGGLFFLLFWIFKSFNSKQILCNFKSYNLIIFHCFCKG